MISSVNFLNPLKFNNVKSKTVHFKSSNDCFIKQSRPEDAAMKYAKEKILQEIKNSGTEYMVVISQDGKILAENSGKETEVSVNLSDIAPESILMHGHPEKFPLSPADITTLLSSGAKSEEAIMQDGYYSKMTKLPQAQSYIPTSGLYQNLEQRLCLAAMKEMGLDCSYKEDDVLPMAKDYLSKTLNKDFSQKSKDEVFIMLNALGVDTSQNFENVYNQLKQLMDYSFSNLEKYDKQQNMIMQNYDKIQDFLNSDDGKFVRHKFLEEIAKEYNLKYETNLY